MLSSTGVIHPGIPTESNCAQCHAARDQVAQQEESRLALEEILVTGTKRVVAQQDLGMSVSTLTAQQIRNSFSTDVTAVTQLAPQVSPDPWRQAPVSRPHSLHWVPNVLSEALDTPVVSARAGVACG